MQENGSSDRPLLYHNNYSVIMAKNSKSPTKVALPQHNPLHKPLLKIDIFPGPRIYFNNVYSKLTQFF